MGPGRKHQRNGRGTTTDQLLMMLLSFDKISSSLTEKERNEWKSSMRKAADYLAAVMKPEFASINYVATSTATLAKAGLFFKENSYLEKAKALAHRTISKWMRMVLLMEKAEDRIAISTALILDMTWKCPSGGSDYTPV